MKHKLLCIFLIITTMLLSSGCWDKIEIDERAFIYLMALDLNKEGQESTSSQGKMKAFYDNKNNKIKALFFNPIPSKLLPGGEVKAFKFEKTEGQNVSEAIRNLDMELERTPFFGQTKVLVIGEKLLSDEKTFREVIDFMERQHEINIDIDTVVLQGDIEDLEKLKPGFEKIIASYMEGILKNAGKLTPVLSPQIHEVFTQLRSGNEGNAVLPYMKIEKDNAKITGFSFIKHYKLYKTIEDKKYIRPYAEIIGKLKGGKKIIEYKKHSLVYDISSLKRNICLLDDKNLEYKINLFFEGDLEENYFGELVFNDKVIEQIENKLEQSIKLELEETTKKIQKDIGVDYIGLGDFTRKYHYKTYEKYKDNWDEAFKKAKIDYDVQVAIRRIGTSKE